MLVNTPIKDANEVIDSPLVSQALNEHGKDMRKQVAKRLLDVSKSVLTIEKIGHLIEISHLLGDSHKLRRYNIFISLPDGAISSNKSTAKGRSHAYTLYKTLIKKSLKEGLNNRFLKH